MIISTFPGWQRWLLLSVKRARGSVRTWRFATGGCPKRWGQNSPSSHSNPQNLKNCCLVLVYIKELWFTTIAKIIPITCCSKFCLAKSKKKCHFIADQHVEFLWFTSPAPVVVEHLVAATHGWRSLPGGERHLLVMRTIAEGKLLIAYIFIYSISYKCIYIYTYLCMYINIYMHVRVYMCILYTNIQYIHIFLNIYNVCIRKTPPLSRFQHLLNTMRCWRETSMNWRRSNNNWGNVPQTKI